MMCRSVKQLFITGLEQSCIVSGSYNHGGCRASCPVQVLEEQLGRRGDAVAPLRPVLLRTLADVQQRLTFRVQAFIKARLLTLCCKGSLFSVKHEGSLLWAVSCVIHQHLVKHSNATVAV